MHFKSFHLFFQGIIENVKRLHSIIIKDQRISSGNKSYIRPGRPSQTIQGKAEDNKLQNTLQKLLKMEKDEAHIKRLEYRLKELNSRVNMELLSLKGSERKPSKPTEYLKERDRE